MSGLRRPEASRHDPTHTYRVGDWNISRRSAHGLARCRVSEGKNGDSMETNPSLWVATAPGIDYPTLDRDIEADVIVVRFGITGLTTARLLAGRGNVGW